MQKPGIPPRHPTHAAANRGGAQFLSGGTGGGSARWAAALAFSFMQVAIKQAGQTLLANFLEL